MSYTPQVNGSTLTLYLGICATGRATASSTTLDMVSFGTVYNPRPSITFQPSDVGMPIAIVGGGPVDADMPPTYFVQGALFHTTIAAYVSPTQVTLAAAPNTSIWNTGFATIILFRPCPFASDVANVPLQFQFNSSIAPGTNDTLQFSVLNSLGDVDNPYVDRFGAIQLGQPVYLVSSDSSVGEIFGGYIDTLTTSSYPAVDVPYCWSAKCASWEGLARRRVVPPAIPQSFTGVAGDVVFRKLVLDYLSNDGVAVSTSTAPDITLAAAVGANIGQLLDQVVSLISDETTQWYWTTDAWRTFILATRSATSAPWNVSNGDDLLAGSTPYQQSITQTHNQMANQVYAIGQNTLLNTLNATLVGNGTATTFNLPQNVGAAPTITLNSGAQTVGILGVDTGKNWYWAQGSAVITQDSGGVVLTPSDTLVVSYTPETAAVAQAPNVGSLQSLQAIEGTSANYEHSITVSQPILPDDLLAIATAYETEYGEPASTCQLYTLRPGLKTGQLQAINLAAAGIPSGNYLIATVQITLTGGNVLLWQYTAFGGANIGDSITPLIQFINRQTVGSLAVITPSTPITGPGTAIPGTFASGPNEVLGVPQPLSFPGGVTKGNLLCVIVAGNNFNTTPVLTDTLGNSYTQAVSGHNAGFFPNWIHILYAIANATGANAVTSNGTGSMTICEISGVNALGPVDTTGSNSGSAPTLSVTNADNAVVTGMCMDSSASVPHVTSPEVLIGYTLGLGPASDGAGAVETVSASGSFTSTLASSAGNPIYASVSFNRASPTSPPAQTTTVLANPQGTVTHSTGALTANLPVLGNGGGDVKIGVAGQLVPAGGTDGQFLGKNSSTDYDTSWQTASDDIEINGTTSLNIIQVNATEVWRGQTEIQFNGTFI